MHTKTTEDPPSNLAMCKPIHKI